MRTILALLVAVCISCGPNGGSNPAITAPTIVSFSGPPSVSYGQTATLSWALSGSPLTKIAITTDASVTNTLPNVDLGSNSAFVVPRNTQNFTLTVTNSAGSSSKTVSVKSLGVDILSNSKNIFMSVLAKDAVGNIYAVSEPLGVIYKYTPEGVSYVFYSVGQVGSMLWSPYYNAFIISDRVNLSRADLSGNTEILIPKFEYNVGAVSRAGVIYAYNPIAFDHKITVFKSNGLDSTITGGADFFPARMLLDQKEENLYVMGGISNIFSSILDGIPTLTGSFANVIYKVKLSDKSISLVAGKFIVDDMIGGYADGPGASALFSVLGPAILSNDGNDILITDLRNGVVRKFNLATSQVDTIAGTPLEAPNNLIAPFTPGSYTNSRFIPWGIVQTDSGDIVISVSGNSSGGLINPSPLFVITR